MSKPAVGLTELSVPQTVTSIHLGGWRIDDVPTGLHHDAIFPGESGLLGNGLLATFGVVTIDAKSGHLFLGRSSARQRTRLCREFSPSSSGGSFLPLFLPVGPP